MQSYAYHYSVDVDGYATISTFGSSRKYDLNNVTDLGNLAAEAARDYVVEIEAASDYIAGGADAMFDRQVLFRFYEKGFPDSHEDEYAEVGGAMEVITKTTVRRLLSPAVHTLSCKSTKRTLGGLRND